MPLLHLINDILDFSKKIEAGKLEIEDTDFQLQESLESIADLFANRASKKGLELIIHRHAEITQRARGPLRLRQVLVNLVSNAVKFTERGHIAVTVERSPGLIDSDSDVAISTARRWCSPSPFATLAWVSPTKLTGSSRRFTQVDSSTTRKHGGTGLGLSICRRLCTNGRHHSRE